MVAAQIHISCRLTAPENAAELRIQSGLLSNLNQRSNLYYSKKHSILQHTRTSVRVLSAFIRIPAAAKAEYPVIFLTFCPIGQILRFSAVRRHSHGKSCCFAGSRRNSDDFSAQEKTAAGKTSADAAVLFPSRSGVPLHLSLTPAAVHKPPAYIPHFRHQNPPYNPVCRIRFPLCSTQSQYLRPPALRCTSSREASVR